MGKKISVLLVALFAVLAFCAGCDEKITEEQARGELSGFDVIETADAEIGGKYDVLSISAFGADGKEYVASVKVTCDGEDVAVANGAFNIASEKDYTVTYTVEYKGFNFAKSTVVKPTDTVKPVVAIKSDYKKNPVGQEMTLPEVTATDSGSGVKTVDVKIFDPESVEATAGGGNLFTPQKAGRYTMKVTVYDKFENSATAETFFFAAGNRAEFDALEDFEQGMDSTFVSSSALNFSLDNANDNMCLSASVASMWPSFVIDGKDFNAYMEKGYSALSFSVWGDNAQSFQMYVQTGVTDDNKVKGDYYHTIMPDKKNKIRIPVSALAEILNNNGGKLIVHMINDPLQNFKLFVDDFRGEFTGPDIFDKQAEILPDDNLPTQLAEKQIEKYALFDENGELVKIGSETEAFTFGATGNYTLELNLKDGGTAVVSYSVGVKADASDKDGYPTLSIPMSEVDKLFTDPAVISAEIKISGTNTASHSAYLSNGKNGASERKSLNAGEETVFTLTRPRYNQLKSLNKDKIEIVIFNIREDVPEDQQPCEKIEAFRAELIEMKAVSTTHAASTIFTKDIETTSISVPISRFDTVFADSKVGAVKFTLSGDNTGWTRLYLEYADKSYTYYRLPAGESVDLYVTREQYNAFVAAERSAVNVNYWRDPNKTTYEKVEDFTAWVDDFVPAVATFVTTANGYPSVKIHVDYIDSLIGSSAAGVKFTLNGTNTGWHSYYIQYNSTGTDVEKYIRGRYTAGVNDIAISKAQYDSLKAMGREYVSIEMFNTPDVNAEKNEGWFMYVESIERVEAIVRATTSVGWPEISIDMSAFAELFDNGAESVKFTLNGTHAGWHNFYIEYAKGTYVRGQLTVGGTEVTITKAQYESRKAMGKNNMVLTMFNTGADCSNAENYNAWVCDFQAVQAVTD